MFAHFTSQLSFQTVIVGFPSPFFGNHASAENTVGAIIYICYPFDGLGSTVLGYLEIFRTSWSASSDRILASKCYAFTRIEIYTPISDHMGQVLKGIFYSILAVLHLVLPELNGNLDTFWMQLSWLQCALLRYSHAHHQKNQLGPKQTLFWHNEYQTANKNIKRELVALAWVRSQKMNEINPSAIVLKSQSHIFWC